MDDAPETQVGTGECGRKRSRASIARGKGAIARKSIDRTTSVLFEHGEHGMSRIHSLSLELDEDRMRLRARERER